MIKQINILIVEDEILLAKDLQLRLENNKNYKTTIAQSFENAIKILITEKIDFLIIDITLRGSRSGIDLAKKVNEKFNLPFLFLTSHADQQTFDRAKLVQPHAYLLKPFNDRMISMSIELALSNYNNLLLEQEEETFVEEENTELEKVLFLKKDNTFQKIKLKDIIYLEANSNYTLLHTKEDDYVYATVLKKIQEKLSDNLFVRIHRSYIINTHYVTSFENNNVVLDGRFKLPISKQNKEEVFRRFQKI